MFFSIFYTDCSLLGLFFSKLNRISFRENVEQMKTKFNCFISNFAIFFSSKKNNFLENFCKMTLLLTALVVFTKMFAKINLFLSAIVGSPKMFAKWNLLLAALVFFHEYV